MVIAVRKIREDREKMQLLSKIQGFHGMAGLSLSASPNLAGLGSSGEGETLSGDEAPLHLLGLVNTQISKFLRLPKWKHQPKKHEVTTFLVSNYLVGWINCFL